MELRHFKYFVAVADNLHFGRAATKLGIAQPVLSRKIKQMEKEMEVQLFKRTKHSVQLTHAGSVFLGSARQILSQMDVAFEATSRAAAGRVGILRVACGPVTTYTVLPTVLELIKQRIPNIDLRVSHGQTADQASALLSHEIDVAFLIPPIDHGSLRTLPVVEEPLVAVLPRRHRLSKNKKIRLLDLAEEEFIFPLHRANKTGLYDSLENICRRAGFTPKIAHEAYPIQTMLALVAAGFGVSLVPESVQRFMRANATFVPIHDRTNIQFAMAWRRSETSPVVSAFVDLVTRQAVKRLK